jgi:hypothetical protein
VTQSSAPDVIEQLADLADPADAVHLQRFFKTAPGEYGEGDVFIGVRVPKTRSVVKKHVGLALPQIRLLLDSDVHEHRLAGLLILVAQFEKVSRPKFFDGEGRARIAGFYLTAVEDGRVNNWDLVDSSAGQILGGWLYDRDRRLIFELSDSGDLWRRRVALLTTYGFITRGDASTPLIFSSTATLPRHLPQARTSTRATLSARLSSTRACRSPTPRSR